MKNAHEWRTLPCKCLDCERNGEFYGRVVFPNEAIGRCPNHKSKVDPEGLAAPLLVPSRAGAVLSA